MNFAHVHGLTSGAIRLFAAPALMCVLSLFPTMVRAQATTEAGQTPAAMKDKDKHVAASPISLRELVQEVQQNNPEVAASRHAWKAAANVPKQASALPETQITVQQFSVGSPRPFAGFSNSDFAYVGIGASQDLPYPGKRRLRSEVAEHEADAVREQSDGIRRQTIETVKLLYFQLAYLQQTLPVLERNDQLLDQIQQAAESRYRVGQGNQQDVLKAQLQHTKILREIAMHHQDEGQFQAQLKQVLNRPQSSPDIVTEPLSPTALKYSDADLMNRVRDQNPDVRSRAEMVHRQETQVELSRKEFRPDFNVGYMYEHTADQFRDYYMASFGIRLPNRGRQSAALAEAIENQDRAKKDLQAETQRVLSEVEQQYVVVRRSEDQLKIYTEGLIPQSEATFQAGLAAYQSNRQDFETLLSSFQDLLYSNLEYQRELVENLSALARLEGLTGVSLP
ncbi:MAG: outer rane efflux protein [Acidobacteriaceae bacterium]|nr:outer rane efflux protein [Acidobacteriaceae bacterium]